MIKLNSISMSTLEDAFYMICLINKCTLEIR